MSRPSHTKTASAVARYLREAEEAWSQQDYQKSIGLIEKATRKEPSNPGLLLDLARAHGMRYDLPGTKRWIERAVQISSQRAHTLEEAGRVCLEIEQVDLAI